MSELEKKPIYILGISAYYHDSAACLLRDGQIIAAAQEERFTRKKHDESFPVNAVQYCLGHARIGIKDIHYVGFYEKPFLKFERLLLTYLNYAPQGLPSFLKAMPAWLKEKIFIKNDILKNLGYEGEILFAQHHESHAASAFFPSPFKSAAILTMDGVGEWATTTYGAGEGNKIKLDSQIRFPHSLGLLYSAFTYYGGFRVNSGEYKLMGLAPYGEPKYVDLIYKELIDVKDDGSFRLNMDYFNYAVGLTMTNDKFHRLFGRSPRKPESPITSLDMDLARSIQEVTEDIMVKMANHVHAVTGQENICLAGGVALNCVGNGKIIEKTKFKNVWVQPAAGDAGGAWGVALFIWYQYLNNARLVDGEHDLQNGSSLGMDYSDDEVEIFLKAQGISYERFEEKNIFDKIAQLISDEKVIGLVQGRMEFGPRALGNRSIIGDARSINMQEKMNVSIKFRESFRPFAPSILKERLQDYFDLRLESPYMLFIGKVRESQIEPGSSSTDLKGLNRLKVKRSSVPAITHVDYSARIQTVDPVRNPFYYKIIESFYKKTGCPVIINTSFNIRGEPMVASLEDAYRCFMCTHMDYLVINRFILDKKMQPHQDRYKKEQISTMLD